MIYRSEKMSLLYIHTINLYHSTDKLIFNLINIAYFILMCCKMAYFASPDLEELEVNILLHSNVITKHQVIFTVNKKVFYFIFYEHL